MKGPELIPLFHNCLQVQSSCDGLFPLRHTAKQLDFYKDIPYGKHMLGKALSSVGVTLECITDSPEIDLHWMIDAGYPDDMENRKSTLDLYVDNALVFQLPITCLHRTQQKTHFSLPEGNKYVRFVLPQTYRFVLKEINFPAGCCLEPVDRRKRNLLFLCDSLGQGIGASSASTGYAIQTMLRMQGFEVFNQSVGGLRFDAPSIDPHVPAPELIWVQIGTNDWQRRKDRQDFSQAMESYLQCLVAAFPNIPVLLLSPTKRCDGISVGPEMYREEELFDVMKAHCETYHNISCYNGWSLMPRTARFFADGVHPNDAGHLWLAANVSALIQRHLQNADL